MGIRNPLHAGFLGVRKGTHKSSMTGAVGHLKCPKEGCAKPDGHAPKTHGTQRDVRLKAAASRQAVVLGRFTMPHSPRVVNPKPHDQFGRRVVSRRLRLAYEEMGRELARQRPGKS
jgi:hypothetical protein